jgi:hypothetical protein
MLKDQKILTISVVLLTSLISVTLIYIIYKKHQHRSIFKRHIHYNQSNQSDQSNQYKFDQSNQYKYDQHNQSTHYEQPIRSDRSILNKIMYDLNINKLSIDQQNITDCLGLS